YVYDVAFRPDGNEVASGAWDGTVRRWDPATGRETAQPLRHEKLHGQMREKLIVTSLAYSPDGQQLAVVVRDEGVRLWDLARGESVLLQGGPARDWSRECRVAFHPGGKLLASGSVEGTVRLWDLTTKAVVGVLTGHQDICRAVAFRPDGGQLASADVGGTV